MGDPPGFEQFFEAHHEPVVRALTLVFDDRPAAEDAAQVGFERAYARWSRVSAMERPGTWVYVVALRHGRSRLRGREVLGGSADVATGDHAEATVQRLTISEQVRHLPPRQRAVVILRHLSDLRLDEIADALGMRLGTVKSTLHAAHQRLRVEQEHTDPEVVTPHAH